MKKTLQEIFPRASKAFLLANPVSLPSDAGKTIAAPLPATRRRGVMNVTESEYALFLEAELRERAILRFEFEGITLRWADMRYTPDFIVFFSYSEVDRVSTGFKLVEVKGAHIWDRDIVRFKGARAYWPQFQFEMWQKTKAGWRQKY